MREPACDVRSRVDSSYRSSVEPHYFGSSEAYTLGVEEEFMLLDPETLGLVQRADTILDADHDGEFAARTSCEIFQSEIEGQTPICATVADAAAELRRLREHLERVVREQGLVLASRRHASVRALRGPAHHRSRALPAGSSSSCSTPPAAS